MNLYFADVESATSIARPWHVNPPHLESAHGKGKSGGGIKERYDIFDLISLIVLAK
jgi:hypothetical protein